MRRPRTPITGKGRQFRRGGRADWLRGRGGGHLAQRAEGEKLGGGWGSRKEKGRGVGDWKGGGSWKRGGGAGEGWAKIRHHTVQDERLRGTIRRLKPL